MDLNDLMNASPIEVYRHKLEAQLEADRVRFEAQVARFNYQVEAFNTRVELWRRMRGLGVADELSAPHPSC